MATKKSAKQKVTFSILAPAARSVQLVGDFSGWEQHPVDLKKLKNGEWKRACRSRKANTNTATSWTDTGAMIRAARGTSQTHSVRKTAS